MGFLSLFTTDTSRPMRAHHVVKTAESTTYRLYLGGTRFWQDTGVSRRELQTFLLAHVTPHFPTFTVLTADGFYAGKFEKVWVLELIVHDREDQELQRRIQEIGRIWAESQDQVEVFINCFHSGSTSIHWGDTRIQRPFV